MKIRYQISDIRYRSWGFTLIELLTAVSLVVLLTLALSAIVVTAQRSAAIERLRSDLTAENRRLVDDTTRNVKLASAVVSSATVLGTSYTTDSSTLVLQLPAIDSSQNLISGINDLLVYRLTGTDYEFIQDGGAGSTRPDTSSRIYSDRVDSLAFTYFDSSGSQLASNYQNAQSVQIAATLADTVRSKTITITLTERASLRNK